MRKSEHDGKRPGVSGWGQEKACTGALPGHRMTSGTMDLCHAARGRQIAVAYFQANSWL